MARTFEQVLADVSKQSDPQRQTILSSIADLPNQQAAAESQLTAKKDQAYTDILDAARRRGTGVAFGGIPLSEQAKYNATEYAPAVANLKTSYNDRKSTLENALAQIGQNDYSNAYNIYNTDRQFEESQRQFNAQLAESRRQAAATLAASDLSKYFNTGKSSTTSNASSTPAASYGFKNGSNGSGGFYFTDANGNSISAAKYASLTGTNLLTLINKMANAGDAGAKSVMSGPGVNTNSLNYKKYFAWDIPTTSAGNGGGGGGW